RIKAEIMNSPTMRPTGPDDSLRRPQGGLQNLAERGVARSAPDLKDEKDIEVSQLGLSEGCAIPAQKGAVLGTETAAPTQIPNEIQSPAVYPSLNLTEERTTPGVHLLFKWLQFGTKLLIKGTQCFFYIEIYAYPPEY